MKAEDFKKLMKNALVYDGRNIYDVEKMKRAGVQYYSIGRPSSIKPYESEEEVATSKK